MELPRSILEIYNLERERKGQKRADNQPGAWREIPALYQWKERAALWDTAELERKSQLLAARREQQRTNELEDAQTLRDKAKLAAMFPLTDSVTQDGKHIKGDHQVARTAAMLFAESVKQARMALEMATTNTKIDLGKLNDDELTRLYLARIIAEQGGVRSGDEAAGDSDTEQQAE